MALEIKTREYWYKDKRSEKQALGEMAGGCRDEEKQWRIPEGGASEEGTLHSPREDGVKRSIEEIVSRIVLKIKI